MNAAVLTAPLPERRKASDRLGVAASILCAIHCLVTPPLLLLAPAFGRLWAHPASHWGMALFVVPLAIFTIARGFRIHGRKWVPVVGSLGVALIFVGAALPYLGPETAVASDRDNCEACCPSVQTTAGGETRLEIPPASIVTTLGGAALVLTHLGNLGCRRRCCASS